MSNESKPSADVLDVARGNIKLIGCTPGDVEFRPFTQYDNAHKDGLLLEGDLSGATVNGEPIDVAGCTFNNGPIPVGVHTGQKLGADGLNLADLRERAEKAAFRCCDRPDTGGEYMGSVEYICCGEPEETEADMTIYARDLVDLLDRVDNDQRLLSQLREELAQRDAEIANLQTRLTGMTFDRNCRIEERNEARKRLAALESQQAASVGGEREAFEVAFPGFKAMVEDAKASRAAGRRVEQPSNMFRVWLHCRAALSPAGGGVVEPARKHSYEAVDRYLRNNLDDDDYAEYSEHLENVLNAKPIGEV